MIGQMVRRRPPEFEARQWLPGDPRAAGQVIGWIVGNGGIPRASGGSCLEIKPKYLYVLGDLPCAWPGDWILLGPDGSFDVCTQPVFEREFEKVNAR